MGSGTRPTSVGSVGSGHAACLHLMTDIHIQRAQVRIGQVLCGKWRVEALLGAGGMASVYAAVHRNGKRVALKVLHAELSEDPDTRTRFLREGYLANKVEHHGCVSVIDDAVAEDGAVLLVMELLEGSTLQSLASRTNNRLPAADLVGYMDQLLDVLAAAHDKGIIHRDIKPDNLFLTNDGIIKVFDFGLARIREHSVNPTVSGSIMGTPAFMAPEQAMGKSSEQDGRTDIFATGATMFTLLTGRLIHMASSVTELLLALVTKPVAPIATVLPGLPPGLAVIVDRALAFNPEERWSDVRSMQAALRVAGLPRPPRLSAAPHPYARSDISWSNVMPQPHPANVSASASAPRAARPELARGSGSMPAPLGPPGARSAAPQPAPTPLAPPVASAPAAPSRFEVTRGDRASAVAAAPSRFEATWGDRPSAAGAARSDGGFRPTNITVPMPKFESPLPLLAATVERHRKARAIDSTRRLVALVVMVVVMAALLTVAVMLLWRGFRSGGHAPELPTSAAPSAPPAPAPR
jgi:eukaryotic-like serine/threonine-protein kinase